MGTPKQLNVFPKFFPMMLTTTTMKFILFGLVAVTFLPMVQTVDTDQNGNELVRTYEGLAKRRRMLQEVRASDSLTRLVRAENRFRSRRMLQRKRSLNRRRRTLRADPASKEHRKMLSELRQGDARSTNLRAENRYRRRRLAQRQRNLQRRRRMLHELYKST